VARLSGSRRRPAWLGAALVAGLVLVVPTAHGAPADRPLAEFPGLARVFADLTVSSRGTDAAAAALFDFDQVLVAVAGHSDGAGRTLDEYRRAFAGERSVSLPADRATRGRDDTAYRLHSLGYSAREIADILAGRIGRRALDNGQKLLMMGESPERVSDYLDREYRRVADARSRAEQERLARERARSGRGRPRVDLARLEALVSLHADTYGVPSGLVRAVIAVESNWDPAARSHAGAIGLMQLMPGTARELGVDRLDPGQNIEGGVRYLAWLLRTFGSVERALIAYNAGPGFAERLARGEVALYGETRDYVSRVLAARPF
jgi:hypothetical protein